jgi:signal transduction histidine kinase
MRSLSLSKRMIAASLILAALVAGIFAVLIVAVTSLDDAREREAHSKEVAAATVVVEKLVVDMETGLRGFVLSRDARELRLLTRAQRQVGPRLEGLEELVADDPVQRRRVRELRRAIDDYVLFYALPIANIARDNPAVARSQVADEEGKQTTDDIRARLAAVLETENARVEASAASANTLSRRAIALGIAGLAACALLIVLFGLYQARSTARPIRAVAAAANRLASGDLSVRVPERGPAEVGELAVSFNQMAGELERGRAELESQNQKLRESERRKSELVRIVSHELRTPLASILGFTSLLLNRDIEEREQVRYLEIIDREGRRLSALLNDFLDAERLDEGELMLNRQVIDMGEVIAEQVRLFEGQSARHHLDLVLPEAPLQVHGDPNRLAQVVANLLSNAIKYSPEGGVVQVTAEPENGHVRISVRDEGLGIADELKESVFAKFFRGDASASGIPGTGLGLTIARSVVEAHGGRMSFESGRGEGSVFWMELPLAAKG